MRSAKKKTTHEKQYFLPVAIKMLVSAFAVMAICFLITKISLRRHLESRTDAQAFIDGRSDTLDGYAVGPVMQGIK